MLILDNARLNTHLRTEITYCLLKRRGWRSDNEGAGIVHFWMDELICIYFWYHLRLFCQFKYLSLPTAIVSALITKNRDKLPDYFYREEIL